MKALYYRIKYAVMVFAKRAPIDRSRYITTETGALITDENGEVITTE